MNSTAFICVKPPRAICALKRFHREAITMWERKRSFSLLVRFIYISQVHGRKWPELGKSPTSSCIKKHHRSWKNASFWRVPIEDNTEHWKELNTWNYSLAFQIRVYNCLFSAFTLAKLVDKNKTVPCGWKTNSVFMQILRKKYDVYGRLSLGWKPAICGLFIRKWPTQILSVTPTMNSWLKKIPLLENTKKEISLYY